MPASTSSDQRATVAGGSTSPEPSGRQSAQGQAPGWAVRAAVVVVFDRELDVERTLQQLKRIARHIVLVDNSPHGVLGSIQCRPQLTSDASVMLVPNGNVGGLA